MTQKFFKEQIARLQVRFGERAFDNEFNKLAWEEVREMSESHFKKTVDRFIGHKSPFEPPMLTEFREARLAGAKSSLRAEATSAARAFGYETGKSVQDALRPLFGEVSGVIEAIQVARRRARGGS